MNQINSRTSFGLLLFLTLLPLSFRVSQQQVEFLLDTEVSWIAHVSVSLAITVLLVLGKQLNKAQTLALAVLFASLPFSFSFAEQTGIQFIMLTKQFNLVILLWTAAAISFHLWRSNDQLLKNSDAHTHT